MTVTELKDALREVLGPLWLEANRSAHALERIADGVEQLLASGADDGEELEPRCTHPPEKRLALGTVGHGWQCACGHREMPGAVDC